MNLYFFLLFYKEYIVLLKLLECIIDDKNVIDLLDSRDDIFFFIFLLRI